MPPCEKPPSFGSVLPHIFLTGTNGWTCPPGRSFQLTNGWTWLPGRSLWGWAGRDGQAPQGQQTVGAAGSPGAESAQRSVSTS